MLGINTLKSIRKQQTQRIYELGDTVHWIEQATVVDYDAMEVATEYRFCWGEIIEFDDTYCDGERRAYVTKFYFNGDTVVNYGYATLEAGQVIPPGEFKKMILEAVS